MKKGMILFIIWLLITNMVFCLTPVDAVEPEGYATYIDWDSATSGTNYNRDTFITDFSGGVNSYFYPENNVSATSGDTIFSMKNNGTGGGALLGYWNYSNANFFYGIEFNVRFNLSDGKDQGVYMKVYDSNNNVIMDNYFSWQHVSDELRVTSAAIDYGDVADLGVTWYKFGAYRNNTNFSIYVDDVYATENTGKTGSWADFSYIEFTEYTQDSRLHNFQFDNVTIYTDYYSSYVPPDEEENTGKTINFKFYNIVDAKQYYYRGDSFPSISLPLGVETFNFKMRSDLWSGDYINSLGGLTLSVTANFSEGSTHTFLFTNSLIGMVNFTCYNYPDLVSSTKFKHKTVSLKIYAGQTYNIYFEPTYYTDGVNYSYCGGEDNTDGQISFCLNKQEYDYGETVRMQYTLPTGNWLNNNGWKTEGWYISIYNRDDYFLGLRWDNWAYVNRLQLYPEDFDGNRHTKEFTIAEFENPSKDNTVYGYDEFYNDYELCIINFKAGWFDKVCMFENLIFYCTGSEFTPTGEITDITPSPSYFGQPVQISWTANNAGKLTIEHGSSVNGSNNIIFSTNFGYSDGTHVTTIPIYYIGTFYVKLYVDSDIIGTSLVDTATHTVNALGSEGSYGSIGYGIAYLYIPQYRIIAGYDNITIGYRSYKNDSQLIVKSPRGETTWFSTTVSNESDNVLTFPASAYMQIGTWDVSLQGGHVNGTNVTLYSEFNIVNEEGNWVEFSKNVYQSNEPFGIYLKHDYRVALTFYKNDVAQGENIILQMDEQDGTLYIIPLEKVTPSEGDWRVEMWRINDLNRVYELAEWECVVVSAPFVIPDTGLGFSIASIPLMYRIIAGLGLILAITIIPLILALQMSKRNISINMPPLVYVAFFFTGVILSVAVGLLGIEWLFLILIGLVLMLVITWLQRQSDTGVKNEE